MTAEIVERCFDSELKEKKRHYILYLSYPPTQTSEIPNLKSPLEKPRRSQAITQLANPPLPPSLPLPHPSPTLPPHPTATANLPPVGLPDPTGTDSLRILTLHRASETSLATSSSCRFFSSNPSMHTRELGNSALP